LAAGTNFRGGAPAASAAAATAANALRGLSGAGAGSGNDGDGDGDGDGSGGTYFTAKGCVMSRDLTLARGWFGRVDAVVGVSNMTMHTKSMYGALQNHTVCGRVGARKNRQHQQKKR
jgi:hypothetical protein